MATYRTTIINGRNCCWSPHLRVNPTDRANPSPDVLPPEARRLWDATRANAHSYYSGAWDLADMAAWRAVKMKYPNGIGQWRPMRNPAPLKQTAVPDPGEQIELGRVLEYVVEEAPPRLAPCRTVRAGDEHEAGDHGPRCAAGPEMRGTM